MLGVFGLVFHWREGGGVGGGGREGVAEDDFFDLEFDVVGEFEAVWAEELDAVVLPGVVAGGDDRAGLELVGVGEEGDSGGGDDAGGGDFGASGAQARGEHGGDPRAGLAGVAAEQDAGDDGLRAERVSEGEADGVDGGGVEGGGAGDAADSVCTEELSHGGVILSFDSMMAGAMALIWLVNWPSARRVKRVWPAVSWATERTRAPDWFWTRA